MGWRLTEHYQNITVSLRYDAWTNWSWEKNFLCFKGNGRRKKGTSGQFDITFLVRQPFLKSMWFIGVCDFTETKFLLYVSVLSWVIVVWSYEVMGIDFKALLFFVLQCNSHSTALHYGAQTILSFIEKCHITYATFSNALKHFPAFLYSKYTQNHWKTNYKIINHSRRVKIVHKKKTKKKTSKRLKSGHSFSIRRQ